ncbi:Hypothetical protein PHPALM_21272, partial [Phytophthora palmivora]
MSCPLLIVELVLNHDQNAAALQDLGPTIADFLGPDRYLPLHQACHLGSLKLLDWMWRISPSKASNWSLASHLHSNCHYYHWQFSEALEIAAGRGDVAIVQWIFEHFTTCQVAVEVVEKAAKNGHLNVLQFMWEHDKERMKGEVIADDDFSVESSISSHTVHWGGSSLLKAVENGHLEVVQWLCQRDTHRCDEAHIAFAIKAALGQGNINIAESLLPRGKCILDYAAYCPHQDVIEWKLDCGYFQHDACSAGVAIKDLALSGRLNLMQKLAELHDPPPETSSWLTSWSGSINVMKCLYERGTIDKVRDGLMHAIREGHFDMVKWMIEHFPKAERVPDYCVMDEAA